MSSNHERASLPWFKEAPSSLLADFTYQGLSLEEKGYFHLLRNQFWVNGPLPADNEALDRITSAPPGFSAKAMPKLLGKYAELDAENMIIFPYLDHYRRSQLAGRARMASGGKRGAQVSLQRRRSAKGDAHGEGHDSGGQPSEGYPKGSCSSSQSSSTSDSPSGLYSEADSVADDPWIKAYNKEEAALASSRVRH